MGALMIAATAGASTAGASVWSHATPIILAILGSSLVTALVSAALGNLRASATLRRDRYAEAVRTLVAWNEYPYRIRRRVDDNPETLDKLASLGHDLQERLGASRAWIAGESSALRDVYDGCIGDLNRAVSPACREAWQSAPVTSAAGMNLSGFGGGGASDVVCRMERAVAYRFGWRRALPPALVGVRLRHHGCLPTPETVKEVKTGDQLEEARARGAA
ncbi:MAG TPA: hypothetical protein VK662_06025 [Acidothermaceae bacterium]|jgi:hypothetical protein|nr:hypothetical protein [Acidothermaceae bacterium]